MRHVDFTANFQNVRRATDRLRYIGDSPRVGSHVLSDTAIAARGRLHKTPIFISQGEREAIDLWFSCVGKCVGRAEVQIFADALVEVLDILRIKAVGKRQHSHFVGDLGKPICRRGSDHFSGTVRTLELGKERFYLGISSFERVILGIRHYRRIFGVISRVRFCQSLSKPRQFFLRAFLIQRLNRNSRHSPRLMQTLKP